MNIQGKSKKVKGKRKDSFIKGGLLTFTFYLLSFIALVPLSMATSDSYGHYMIGLDAEHRGDIATALSEYNKAVEQDPNAREVYKDLAELNLRAGHSDEALKAAEKVRNLAPNDPDSYLLLGHVHGVRGEITLAVDNYGKALVLDPHNLKALETLGNYYAATDPGKAFSYYQKYIDVDPNEPEIYFQTGLLYQKKGDFQKAADAYRKAADLGPKEVGPHLALAELYEVEHSTANATMEYQTCSKLNPQNPLYAMRLGHLYYDQGQFDQASQQFQAALSIQPQDASIHYWLARTAEEQKQWDKAAAEAEAAYNASHDSQLLPLLAYYLTLKGDNAAAVKWLEKARAVDPHNANVELFLGMGYLEQNKPDAAKEILEQGIKDHSKDTQLHFQLGIAYDRLNQFDSAMAQFQAVLNLDPENAPAMNYLGYSYADRGIHLGEAEKMLRKAVASDPKNGAYLDSLGWVRYKQKDYLEAISLLMQAVQQTPDAEIYEHLGDAYAANHQPSEALGSWLHASQLSSKPKAELTAKIKNASSSVLPGTDQRKYLKYVEGNFRQILYLRGQIHIHGHLAGGIVNTSAVLLYRCPDRLWIEMSGPHGSPMARIAWDGRQLRVTPKDLEIPGLTEATEPLEALRQLLSGDLTKGLDRPDVQTSIEKGRIHYRIAKQDVWIDEQEGVISKWERDNPQGGRDVMDVDRYTQEEGIILPSHVSFRNRQLKWKVQLNFSRWSVNDTDLAHIFNDEAKPK